MNSALLSQSFRDIRVEGQGNSLIINQIVQIAVAEVKTRPFIGASPYVGLGRFEERNKDFFFGRDALIFQLTQKVAEKNLVFIAGASGSGKSSVVRAGLIPQLAARLPQGLFRPLILTPDRDPFESLRIALISAGLPRKEVDAVRCESADRLGALLTALRPPNELWLLFIDQFEEIFTLCGDSTVRAAFINALVKLARDATPELRLILCMRSDFFDRMSPHPELTALAEQGLSLMADMPASALRQTIEQPAAHQGVVFEESLVEQIIADVRGRPGALPLLQYSLDLLWRQDTTEQSRTLHTATYHRLGGVEGALRLRAEALYNHSGSARKTERPAHEKQALRHIFLRLVDLTAQGAFSQAVSKRTLLSDFVKPVERQLIAELIDEKLLISNAAVDSAASAADISGTVEIAHEALLSAWPSLKTWVEEGREVIYLRNRLRQDAGTWAQTKARDSARADEELITGTRLQTMLKLREQKDFENILGGLTPEEDAFLDASATHYRKHDPTEGRSQRLIGSIFVLAIAVPLILFTVDRTLHRGPSKAMLIHNSIFAFVVFGTTLFGFRKLLRANTFHRGIMSLAFVGLGMNIGLTFLCRTLGLEYFATWAIIVMVSASTFAGIALLFLPRAWLSAVLLFVGSFVIPRGGTASLILGNIIGFVAMGWLVYEWIQAGRKRH